MTMPGRAVWMSTRSRSRVRSTSMRLTARLELGHQVVADLPVLDHELLVVASSNQRDFQSVVTPRRNP